MKAADIVIKLDTAATRQGKTDFKRAGIRNYFNGGDLPRFNKCKNPPKSLGLGVVYAQKPFNQINSEFIRKPGPVDLEICDPRNPETESQIERDLKEELNPIVKKVLKSLIRSLSGDWLLFGRAFAWRNSQDTLRWRAGEILIPEAAPDDVCSDEFWWWGFRSKISLREIDKVIADQREESLISKNGWNLKAIKELKKWILEENEKQKPEDQQRLITDKCINEPFANDDIKPVSVYYYFEKSKELKGSHRKIHLKVISRYGEAPSVDKRDGYKFDLSNPSREKEQIIYELDNAFESIDQCLIPLIGDSRIGGEQRLDQVEGYLSSILPRILRKEHLTDSVTRGAAFASQPNWKAKGVGNDAGKRKYLDTLSEAGLKPWDTLADWVEPMDKRNIIANTSGSMNVIGYLDAHNERDAALGELPGGSSNRRVAVEGRHIVDTLRQEISIRSSLWNEAVSPLIHQVCTTLCRPVRKKGKLSRTSEWKSKDESYFTAKEFQERMKEKHGVTVTNYECSDRIKRVRFRLRDFAGGSDREEALSSATALLNSTEDPAIQRFAQKEMITALYDDEYAEKVLPDERPVDHDQQESALLQINSALVSGIALPPHPGDNASIHTQLNLTALQNQMQTALQQGQVTPSQQFGVQALAQHAAQDAQKLPTQEAQQVIQALQKLLQAHSQIPVNAQGSEIDLKRQKLAHDIQMGQNLMQNRNAGTAMKAEQAEQSRITNEALVAEQLSEGQSRIELNQERAREKEIANAEKTAPSIDRTAYTI